MTLSRPLLWGCLALSIGACSTRQPPEPGKVPVVPDDPAVRADIFVERGWRFELGSDRESIRRNLGAPRRTVIEPIPNPHRPETTDTLVSLVYDGLRVSVYVATFSNRDFLSRLIVTGPRYEMLWDLGVGTSVDRIRELLGEPDDYASGAYVYESGAAATNRVVFHFVDGRVRRIEWQFYVD